MAFITAGGQEQPGAAQPPADGDADCVLPEDDMEADGMSEDAVSDVSDGHDIEVEQEMVASEDLDDVATTALQKLTSRYQSSDRGLHHN